jgi:transposase-like protein
MVKGRVVGNGPRINARAKRAIDEVEQDPSVESRLAMIQMLIPLGLEAVARELKAEVLSLAGARYSRGGEVGRWGSNAGSVYLGDQKVRMRVPRLRHKVTGREVSLERYERLQSPQHIDDMALSRVINGISQGKYERAVMDVPDTFGIKKTSVCRRFIRSSSKRLQEFLSRDLSPYDCVAVVMDGKTFAENGIVIALGITLSGEKVLLGFIETSTENHVACRDFLYEMRDRGLKLDNEILFVIDGGKGLYKGIQEVMGEKAIIQRCQWHKRENVLKYLPEHKKAHYRSRLQAAYEQPTYEKAKRRLEAIKRELSLLNQSALKSLEEGLEQTLTLHRLGLFTKLGRSLKTTNCIENVNKLLGRYTDRVDRWHNSNQRQRWVATALLEMEPGLRRIHGYKFLKELRETMKTVAAEKKQQRIA